MIGTPLLSANSMILMILSPATSPSEPPKVEKSCAYTATVRPWIVPTPVTTESPYGRLRSIPNAVVRWRTYSSNSTKLPWSSSISMRSRAVIFPLACCFCFATSSGARIASSKRARRSAILPAVVTSGWVTDSTLSAAPIARGLEECDNDRSESM